MRVFRPLGRVRAGASDRITWQPEKRDDVMAKLARPQAPAIFRAMFPDLAGWLESPWTGPPPFLVTSAFRVEEMVQDNGYVPGRTAPHGPSTSSLCSAHGRFWAACRR